MDDNFELSVYQTILLLLLEVHYTSTQTQLDVPCSEVQICSLASRGKKSFEGVIYRYTIKKMFAILMKKREYMFVKYIVYTLKMFWEERHNRIIHVQNMFNIRQCMHFYGHFAKDDASHLN